LCDEISLAAVFRRGADAGLIGEFSASFQSPIIVSIFASGLVSLTLTPMMCSRFWATAAGFKKTAVDGFSLALEHRILAVYGRR